MSGVGLGEARTLVGPSPWAELHLRFPETCWAEKSRGQACFLKGPGVQELKETQQVIVSPLSDVFMRGQVRQELPGQDLGARARPAQGVTRRLSPSFSWRLCLRFCFIQCVIQPAAFD